MPLGTFVNYNEIEQFARCPRRWAWGSQNGRNLGFYKQPTNVNKALTAALQAYATEVAVNAESALASAKLVLRAEMDSLPQDVKWDKSLAAGLGALDYFHSRYPTLGFELLAGVNLQVDLFPGTETILNTACHAAINHDGKYWLVRFIVSQRPAYLHAWRWDAFDEEANLLIWAFNEYHVDNLCLGVCYIHVKMVVKDPQVTVQFHTPTEECVNDSYRRAKNTAQMLWRDKSWEVINHPYDRQFWCSHCPFVAPCTAMSNGENWEHLLGLTVDLKNTLKLRDLVIED